MNKIDFKNSREGLESQAWYLQEFADIDFNDGRLNQRLMNLMHSLSEYPLCSVNQACESNASAKAAYRFFANSKVLAQKIRQTHQHQVVQRAIGEKIIFVIQDTCFIDYTSHIKTKGLGKLSNYRRKQNKGKGLAMHTNLLLNSHGTLLGILDQIFWTRPLDQPYGKGLKCYRTPIKQKESYRWLEGIQNTARLFKGSEAPTIIHIADREADIFEFMECGIQHDIKFIVRGDLNPRAIAKPGHKIFNRKGSALFTVVDALNESSLKGELSIEVPKRPSHTNSIGTPERVAEVEIRCCHVKLPPSRHLLGVRRRQDPDRSRPQIVNEDSIEVHVIWVKEQRPPEGAEPLEWILYTNLKVERIEEAAELINQYKLRWKIELLHKILKSGCRIEECRLGDADRLEKYITLFSIIAWRILWMTHLNREHPENSCSSVLTESEWQALYCRIHRTKDPPLTPPTLREAIHWIARLGGFLDRKSDGEPGMITIWRGWQRLSDIAEDWRIFHQNERYG
ncbi:MAG: IS4 family transposase [Pseudobdellovibrionaceae bacterium]